ncbi:FAD-dependent oxidoreductase [Trebonia kvetii]|uniref:FAD-dependent oxidoreductase n=1 Tax=Trebonia kvetii TaxID=2480626 RepID=UPI001C9E3A9D|nr:NAD(P)-binding protein [Trebonia kvetii]
MTRTALIIGGGIAGPVTAMALQKAGIDAVVYEAHPARAVGAGGGFSLAPNGLAAPRCSSSTGRTSTVPCTRRRPAAESGSSSAIG